MLGDLRAAVSFLTPLGGATAPTAGALVWFPLVGAVLGTVLGGWWHLADRLWPPLVAAVLVVTADAALTGLLHLDGLADTADGVLPHLSRERRLAVMAAPDVGAFGVAVVVLALVLRVAAVAALAPSAWLLASLWCASRSVMAVAARALPYARGGGGLATAFLGGSAVPVAVLGGVVAVALGMPAGWHALAALAAAVVAAGAVLWLGVRRLGGFTGDVLGAAGVVGETAGLVVAAAKW